MPEHITTMASMAVRICGRRWYYVNWRKDMDQQIGEIEREPVHTPDLEDRC